MLGGARASTVVYLTAADNSIAPSNPLKCPISPCWRGGNVMVAHLFYSQLALLALVWLFVMRHVAESRRGAPLPPTATPIKPKSKRSTEPKLFHGLTQKPHCALCARETAPPKAPPPGPPDPMAPTHRRPRAVDTSRH